MGREYFAETGHGVKFEFVMILIMVIGLDIIRKFIKPNRQTLFLITGIILI